MINRGRSSPLICVRRCRGRPARAPRRAGRGARRTRRASHGSPPAVVNARPAAHANRGRAQREPPAIRRAPGSWLGPGCLGASLPASEIVISHWRSHNRSAFAASLAGDRGGSRRGGRSPGLAGRPGLELEGPRRARLADQERGGRRDVLGPDGAGHPATFGRGAGRASRSRSADDFAGSAAAEHPSGHPAGRTIPACPISHRCRPANAWSRSTSSAASRCAA